MSAPDPARVRRFVTGVALSVAAEVVITAVVERLAGAGSGAGSPDGAVRARRGRRLAAAVLTELNAEAMDEMRWQWLRAQHAIDHAQAVASVEEERRRHTEAAPTQSSRSSVLAQGPTDAR